MSAVTCPKCGGSVTTKTKDRRIMAYCERCGFIGRNIDRGGNLIEDLRDSIGPEMARIPHRAAPARLTSGGRIAD